MPPDPTAVPPPRSPLAALRRFARPLATAVVERCELCSAALAAEHQHLIEPASRRLLCACDACAVLFSDTTKYRRVPRRVRSLPGLHLDDARWAGLAVPIGLAFFFHSSAAGQVVAVYPSPAGPTEVLLDAGAWEDLVRDNPALGDMEPDVEALLVNRLGRARACLLVPIDVCYQLVGLVRARWRGLSGGDEVHEEITRFFHALEEKGHE